MITFTVYGSPVAQGRPRFFRRGNHVGTYDPAKSKAWKSEVRRQAIEQKAYIQDGPLSLSLRFILLRPKSLPKKVQHHIKKPDLDNLVKGVVDALTGICYKDDSGIILISASKSYGEQPCVTVEIRGAADEDGNNRATQS